MKNNNRKPSVKTIEAKALTIANKALANVRQRAPVRPVNRTIRKKNKRKPLPRAPRPKPTKVPLPLCTLKYLKALTDPFGAEQGACIPTLPAKPSMKVRTFINVDAVIGTQGIGFAMLTPRYEADQPALYYSTATWTNTVLSVSGTGVVTANFDNSPFAAAELADLQVRCRTVAIGMRIMYTGTTLNMSGMTTCLTEPDHHSLLGKDISELLAYGDQVTKTDSFTRKYCSIIAYPISTTDIEYDTVPFRTNGATPQPFMAIMCTGVPGQTFRIQVYHHFEAIGVKAVSPTNNSSDPEGTWKVIDAVEQAVADPNSKTPQKWYQKAWSFIKAAAPVVGTVAAALI